MKVGIKKLQENAWQVHMGCARVKMDRFSVELLNITLSHLSMLESGQTHSNDKSYIRLGMKLMDLDGRNLQILLAEVDNKDLLNLMLAAKQPKLNQAILANVGGILGKQLESDLQQTPEPDSDTMRASIQAVVETMFELEANGKIEFQKEHTQYI